MELFKKPLSWIDVNGKWTFNNTDNIITYEGNTEGAPSFGVCFNDGRINKGEISCKIKISD